MRRAIGAEGLSNVSIEAFLRERAHCKHFEGVFSADTIPESRLGEMRQFAIVVNLSKEEEKGTHFLAIVKLGESALFCLDPLALNFTIHDFIRKFIEGTNCERIYTLRSPVQEIESAYCGAFCIFFCQLFDDFGPDNAIDGRMHKLEQFSTEHLTLNDSICLRNIAALCEQ